ncbi:hypothetical protein KC727_03470 [Candidatus Kaiserbacteria bacterium]|nr:hypothetical protein [Candidatus Kaiserbacteria bacterium]
MESTHYVCTGSCHGVSDDAAATCQAPDCSNNGQPLTACTCTDGQHTMQGDDASAPAEADTSESGEMTS